MMVSLWFRPLAGLLGLALMLTFAGCGTDEEPAPAPVTVDEAPGPPADRELSSEEALRQALGPALEPTEEPVRPGATPTVTPRATALPYMAQTHYNPETLYTPPSLFLQRGLPEPEVYATTAGMTMLPVPEGEAVSGWLAMPTDTQPQAGLVLVHDWWGVQEAVKAEAARLAAWGFAVFVPDLYQGAAPTDRREAVRIIAALDTEAAEATVTRAVAGLAAYQQSGDSRPVAVIGYDFGGTLAISLAQQAEAPAAVIMVHGELPVDLEQAAREISAHDTDFLGVYAGRDEWTPRERAVQFEAALLGAGVTNQVMILDAAPGFYLNPADEADRAYAEETRLVIFQFLQQHLTGEPS